MKEYFSMKKVATLGAVGMFAVTVFITNVHKAEAFDPATLGGFGIMGDSMSDEYRADDNRGGVYSSATFNWMELLVKKGYNFGPWGTRNDVRRSGYEYNWALSGARASDVLATGEATGLAAQVAAGKVQNVIFQIGSNDFASWNGTYTEIYDGTLTDAQVQAKVNQMVSDITTAVDTVRAAGPVRFVMSTAPVRSLAPVFIQRYPDATKRARVDNAIAAVNSGIRAMAAARGITMADFDSYTSTLLPLLDANNNLPIDGEPISLAVDGDEPHHVMLGDSEHLGTVMSGLLANIFVLFPFAQSYGFNILPITQAEMLQNANIPAVRATLTPSVANTTAGSSVTLTWNSPNATSADIDQGLGAVGVASSTQVTPLTTTTYTLTTKNAFGIVDRVSTTVTVTTPPPPDTTAPVVTVVTPTGTLPAGTATTILSVSTDENASCGYDANAATAFNAMTPLSGAATSHTVTLSGLTNGTAYTYYVQCRDTAGNTSGNATVAFQVATPATPTATISATPSTVVSGGSSTLNWSSTNATSCTASGSWTGAKATSGSQLMSNLTANKTYILTCTGAGGSANSSAIVTVTPAVDTQAPIISITSPANGQVIADTLTLTAQASDNVGVTKVEFYSGGMLAATLTTAPFTVIGDTNATPDGTYTFTARAYDAAGNSKLSSPVTITIRNTQPTTFNPSTLSVTNGTRTSGSTAQLTSDDNQYVVVHSTTSGTTRTSMMDLTTSNIQTITPTGATLSFRAKSSQTATTFVLKAFNYVTSTWTTLSTSSIGTTETTQTVAIPGTASDYVSAGRQMQMRFETSRGGSTTYDASYELVQTIVTP